MSERTVKNFLVVYDIAGGHASVQPYGEDYEAAVEAYSALVQEHREDPTVEVVLLGSDSIN